MLNNIFEVLYERVMKIFFSRNKEAVPWLIPICQDQGQTPMKITCLAPKHGFFQIACFSRQRLHKPLERVLLLYPFSRRGHTIISASVPGNQHRPRTCVSSCRTPCTLQRTDNVPLQDTIFCRYFYLVLCSLHAMTCRSFSQSLLSPYRTRSFFICGTSSDMITRMRP